MTKESKREKRRSRPSPGRRPLPVDERKARVIQTRVPDDLGQTLQSEARRLRVTVSQLIRNVLEDTFDLVDHVVTGTRSVGAQVKRDAQRIARAATAPTRALHPLEQELIGMLPTFEADAFADVQAWQEVRVNRPTSCAKCGRALGQGKRAFMGITDGKSAPRWLCPRCESQL